MMYHLICECKKLFRIFGFSEITGANLESFKELFERKSLGASHFYEIGAIRFWKVYMLIISKNKK